MNLEDLKTLVQKAIWDRKQEYTQKADPVQILNLLPKDSKDRWALELAIHNYTTHLPWLEGKAVSLPTMAWIIDHAAEILAAEHAEV